MVVILTQIWDLGTLIELKLNVQTIQLVYFEVEGVKMKTLNNILPNEMSNAIFFDFHFNPGCEICRYKCAPDISYPGCDLFQPLSRLCETLKCNRVNCSRTNVSCILNIDLAFRNVVPILFEVRIEHPMIYELDFEDDYEVELIDND